MEKNINPCSVCTSPFIAESALIIKRANFPHKSCYNSKEHSA